MKPLRFSSLFVLLAGCAWLLALILVFMTHRQYDGTSWALMILAYIAGRITLMATDLRRRGQ